MTCSKCKKYTEERAFATYRDRNGLARRRGICQLCRGQYSIENFEFRQKWRKKYNIKNRENKKKRDCLYKKRAKDFVDFIKSKTACFDCGISWPSVSMDFDHVGGKTKGISSMVSQGYKIALIAEEIKLCEIVCACCHRIRTASRKQNALMGYEASKNLRIVVSS